MPQDVSTRTMESESYSPEDWIPYLEPFHRVEAFSSRWPDEISLKEYLTHEDNRTGGNPSYEWGDGAGFLYLEYSPYLRSEHGIMLQGDVVMNKEWGKFPNHLSNYHFLRPHGQNTLFPVERSGFLSRPDVHREEVDVAALEIPESAKKEELKDTADTIELIISNASQLLEKRYQEKREEEDAKRQDLIE